MRAFMLFALFAAPAWAEAPAAGAATSPFGGLLPILAIGVIFYFLMIRPQQKKFKAHQAMIAAIARGDRIVTAGGVYGKVTKVNEDGTLKVEIADNMEIVVEQATVSAVKAKTEPAKPATDKQSEQANAKKGGKKAANDNR